MMDFIEKMGNTTPDHLRRNNELKLIHFIAEQILLQLSKQKYTSYYELMKYEFSEKSFPFSHL